MILLMWHDGFEAGRFWAIKGGEISIPNSRKKFERNRDPISVLIYISLLILNPLIIFFDSSLHTLIKVIKIFNQSHLTSKRVKFTKTDLEKNRENS